MTNPPPSPGRFVGEGKYELLSPIGLGAMGVVYLARHVALDRVVAVKLLNAGLTSNADAAERFLREARAASLLRHKNTVHVLDFGGDQTSGFFLVMEYIEGKNLSEVMAEEGTLAPARAIAIANQVLAALAEAHEFEIVHRDIKPANIMLVPWTDDDGKDIELVKVLDFGLATMRSEPRGHMRDEIAGTPEYMSPEQAQGLELDARSDEYAVATTLYAMICGEVPFAFESALETMLAQVSTPPRSPRALAPHLSVELDHVILKALAKSPADRYTNARAFRTALLEVPEVVGVRIAQPPTPMILPAPIVPLAKNTESSIARVEEPKRSHAGLWVAFAVVLLGAGALVVWQMGLFAPPQNAVEQVAAAPAPATEAATQPPALKESPTRPPEPIAVAPSRVPDPVPAPVTAPTTAPAPAPEPVAVVEPVKAEPLEAQVVKPEPIKRTEPKRPKPTHVTIEPPKPEPEPVAAVEPPKPEPEPVAVVEPVKPEPEPVKPEPVKPEPIQPKPAPVLAANAGVSSLVVDGSLPKSSVARALDALKPALEACYQAAARSANADAHVSATVHFEIDVDGRTRNVAVGPMSLPGLQSCASATVARVRTKDRPDTGTVGATFHLSFTPRVP